jgi:hypothetical protein
VRLPRKIKADLVKYAKAQGCSESWLIVDVLAKFFEWKKAQEKKK